MIWGLYLALVGPTVFILGSVAVALYYHCFYKRK
jgi:hypothetical protein